MRCIDHDSSSSFHFTQHQARKDQYPMNDNLRRSHAVDHVRDVLYELFGLEPSSVALLTSLSPLSTEVYLNLLDSHDSNCLGTWIPGCRKTCLAMRSPPCARRCPDSQLDVSFIGTRVWASKHGSRCPLWISLLTKHDRTRSTVLMQDLHSPTDGSAKRAARLSKIVVVFHIDSLAWFAERPPGIRDCIGSLPSFHCRA